VDGKEQNTGEAAVIPRFSSMFRVFCGKKAKYFRKPLDRIFRLMYTSPYQFTRWEVPGAVLTA